MGKNLHPSILPFVLDAVERHQDVKSVSLIPNADHYIYRIERRGGMRDVILLISDCYHFSEFDYYAKPRDLDDGGFILIARPESTFPNGIQEQVIEDKIIIGKIGILLGALRKDDFWTYKKQVVNKKSTG